MNKLGFQTVHEDSSVDCGDDFNVPVMMKNRLDILEVPHHDQRLRQVYLHTLATPGVWLFTLVSLVAALLPDVVIRQKKLISTFLTLPSTLSSSILSHS